MKITLHRVVANDIDILLDKQLKNASNAESFFLQVASNLTAKGFKKTKVEVNNGRQFWSYVLNNKKYILSIY